MKSKFTHIIAVVLFVFSAFISSAQTTSTDSSMYYINVGDTGQIKYLIPTGTTISWNSSDPKIAIAMSDGMVIGVAPGFATVYLTKADGSSIMKWPVQVVSKSIDTGTVITPEPINYNYYVKLGQTINIQPSATIAIPYTWVSVDNSIATVDQKGNVKGIKSGNVTIYMSLSDSSALSKFNIFVIDTINTIDTGIVIKPEPPVYQYDFNIKIGEKFDIAAKLQLTSSVQWFTSDSTIAKIDSKGIVIGLSSGVSVIYVNNPNDSIFKKYTVQVIDTTTYVDPIKKVQYIKLAIGGKYTFKSDSSTSFFTSSDSTIKAIGFYNFEAKVAGETKIGEYDRFGNLLKIWMVYVYSNTVDTNTTINPGQPVYKDLYLSVGETTNLYEYIPMSSPTKIEWYTNGVIKTDSNGTFTAIAEGYTKFIVRSKDSTSKWYMVFVINITSNKNIAKDSLMEIIAAPVISAANFQYQNYKSIEKIDSNEVRIIFDKEITDISEIEKYLQLHFDDPSVSTQLKAGTASLTITNVTIDPTNKKAIIITTKEVIPSTAAISVVYNNVSILSTAGVSSNKMTLSNNQVTFIKSAKPVDVTVYPTIANTSITVSGETIISIEIYSSNGELIDKLAVNSTIQTVDVSAYRPGTYFVKLKTSEAQTISKLFIKL